MTDTIHALLSIPGVVLGTELPNLDALDDIAVGKYEPQPEPPKPADVGTAARYLAPGRGGNH
ncbi:MAG: hypothetical protein IT426_18215 [Pirellulales bacterium]|nr:hypothetical protein [Pirellulales bacterium]